MRQPRGLRTRNSVTWFTVAGLLGSAAALLMVIGIGEVQIAVARAAAATPPKVGQGRLFGNGWFDGGGILAVMGVVVATVAIVANHIQVRRERDFPDIKVGVELTQQYFAKHDIRPAGTNPTPVRMEVILVCARLRVENQEAARRVVLSLELWWRELIQPFPRLRTPREQRFLSPGWAVPEDLGLRPLGDSICLEPGSAVEGDAVFEVPTYWTSGLDMESVPRIEIWDRTVGRGASIPVSPGTFRSGVHPWFFDFPFACEIDASRSRVPRRRG